MENELRLNNIVGRGFMNPSPTGLKKEFEPCEIKSIGIERVIVNSKIMSNELIKMGYDNIKPVQITEYWLINFGFGKSDSHEMGDNEHLNFGFYYDYHFKRFRLEADDVKNSVDVNMDIQYVHQLQNIYFALTNKELTLNTK